MTGLCGGHAPMIPPIAQQGKPLRLGISPGGYKRRVPSRTSCVRSISIRFMQTDSLFRKPSENEGSETQQRPRLSPRKWVFRIYLSSEHSAVGIIEVTPATEPDCAAFLRALTNRVEISRPRSRCSRLPARGSPPMFRME
jgi:hypothetical protein